MKDFNLIIGISGKIGSGKDFMADFIYNKIMNEFNKLADMRKFADKVKEVSAVISDQPLDYMYIQEKKNIYLPVFNLTIGELQQIIGTEIFRRYDENFWIKSAFQNNDYGLVIISDVRFKNEADFIKKENGILIRLEGDPMNVRKNSKRNLNHISETDLDDYKHFDIIYHNELNSVKIENFWDDVKKLIIEKSSKNIKHIK